MVFMFPRLGIVKLWILLNIMEIVVVTAIDNRATINISTIVFFEERKKAIKEWNLFIMFSNIHRFKKMY